MPDPTRPQVQPTNTFLEQLCERSQDPFRNGQIMELSSKIDHLIDMLTPPKSAIITGPEVERVIKEIEKARGAGMNQTLLHKMPESLKKALQEHSLRSYALAKMQLDNYSKRIKL